MDEQRRILRANENGWHGVEAEGYRPGDSIDTGVSRHTLIGRRKDDPGDPGPGSELRYFAVGPGKASRLEKHEHEHYVIVREGSGYAIVGDAVSEVSPGDIVYVGPMEIHQFVESRRHARSDSSAWSMLAATFRRCRRKKTLRGSTLHPPVPSQSPTRCRRRFADSARRMTIERTVEIRRPMSDIYEYICDPSRLNEWRDGLLGVERLSPHGMVDGAGISRNDRHAARAEQVTVRLSTTPPERLSFEVLDGPFRPDGSLEMRDLGGITELTYRMQGPTVMGIPTPLDRVVEDLLTKNVENSVANLKRLLEA